MKILMLAWKDMQHPKKGGAEVVTDHYLKRLSKKHDVTLFASRFKKSKKEEIYNGYKILRQGNSLFVYPAGAMHCILNEYDIIIDQVNSVPFMTPLYVKKEKRVAFFHQLALEVWHYEMPRPFSQIGEALEHYILPLYSRSRCLTISKSTSDDLKRYAHARDIKVITNTVDIVPRKSLAKKMPAFVYVGRLSPAKRIEDCIDAAAKANARLYIIGSGNEKYVSSLKKIAEKKCTDAVFLGQVSASMRDKILSRCYALVMTSVREGWGLVVSEAYACGTTAITYDSPGIRDSNTCGIICEKNTPDSLSKHMSDLIGNKKKAESLGKMALQKAKEMPSWDENVEEFEQWLQSFS